MADITASKSGTRTFRAYLLLVLIFLYAPIGLLIVFSFNAAQLPVFPLVGFTFRWYSQFLSNSDLISALKASAEVALASSVLATSLGVLASIALVRRRIVGRSVVSALLLSPLVIPYVAFGISLVTLFRLLNVSLSLLTVAVGHVVIAIPFTILVLVPRLQRIGRDLEEAARDLGASAFRTFRSIVLPLLAPAVVSALLMAFTLSFDEYAVASFLVGNQATFPVYLYSQMRFPSRLPQVIAVAAIVMLVSFAIVIGAEIGQTVVERRLGAVPSGRSEGVDR